MKREKGKTYISLLSGGQDSTAMTLKLLEDGYPLDYIIFTDTTLEHKEMYEYIDKLDVFFQRKYGIKITRLKPNKSFEYWVFGKTEKGDNIGMIRGTPRVSLPCFWRREAKEYPLNRWLKENHIKNYHKYVGFTISETKRAVEIETFNASAPLIEWGWSEREVQTYLNQCNMENKLYQHFSRTGCAICPKQTLNDKYQLWKNYPDAWRYMKDIEEKLKLKKKANNEVHDPAWHDKLFIHEMEKLFIKKSKQATFEFEFEPIQDCFCKI